MAQSRTSSKLSRRAFVSGGLKLSTGFVGGLVGAASLGLLGDRSSSASRLANVAGPSALASTSASPKKFASPTPAASKLADVPHPSVGTTSPGWSIAYYDDKTDGGTPSINLQASGAANSKALMRLVPSGRGNTRIGDRAEFTLMGTALGTGQDWWADYKVRERLGDQVRFAHLLSDSSEGTEPVTRYVVEIDGTNHSRNIEHFTIVRNAWIDGARGDQQVMLDVTGDTGITAIANTKIAVGGLKIGPPQVGEITIYLDDGQQRSAFTRQGGVNGDLVIRNFGQGRVVLRPNDHPGGDLTIDASGTVQISGGLRIAGGIQPLAGTVGIGNQTGIGNGSESPLSAPSRGSSTGPANLRVRSWIQATNGSDSGWIPFFT